MVRVISFVACFGAGWGSKNPGFVEVTRILVFSKGLQPIRINELLVVCVKSFDGLLDPRLLKEVGDLNLSNYLSQLFLPCGNAKRVCVLCVRAWFIS
jgi:hypothetical protein